MEDLTDAVCVPREARLAAIITGVLLFLLVVFCAGYMLGRVDNGREAAVPQQIQQENP